MQASHLAPYSYTPKDQLWNIIKCLIVTTFVIFKRFINRSKWICKVSRESSKKLIRKVFLHLFSGDIRFWHLSFLSNLEHYESWVSCWWLLLHEFWTIIQEFVSFQNFQLFLAGKIQRCFVIVIDLCSADVSQTKGGKFESNCSDMCLIWNSERKMNAKKL